MTPAERQRAYRARNGAGTTPGPAPSAPCGTVSAYKRHIRHGATPCTPCRLAYNSSRRTMYAARNTR